MKSIILLFTCLIVIVSVISCEEEDAIEPIDSRGDGLSSELLFFGYPPLGSEPLRGEEVFGIDHDTQEALPACDSGSDCIALFEGTADDGLTQIVSNGRTCFTCHRPKANFQIGSLLPLDQNLPPDDPLIVFVDADAQSNPDAPKNLNDFGLIVIRPHRFANLSKDDPYRKVFAWRKAPTNLNVAFGHGFLQDLRGPAVRDADRGASMSHTQEGDVSFTNLATQDKLDDLEAFQFTLFTDPRLEALLYPGDDSFNPTYEELVAAPYLTVPIETEAQARGKEVFDKNCFVCHNVPNVFNNRLQADPSKGGIVGRGFDIGVAQANFLNLDFRYFNPETGEKELVILPLETEAAEIVNVSITKDPGLAAITRQLEDLSRFKIPQLRNVSKAGPYMHDNSLKTLEDVVDYFNSQQYNTSRDGQQNPIQLTPQEKSDLLEFLKIL